MKEIYQKFQLLKLLQFKKIQEELKHYIIFDDTLYLMSYLFDLRKKIPLSMAAVMQYDSNIFCYVHQYWHSAYMGAQNYFVSKLHTDYASRAIYIVSSLILYNYFLISIYFGMWLQYRIHAVTLIEDFIPPKHGKTFVL